MIGLVAALLSSVLWGGSDFAAGVSARGAGPLRAAVWSYLGASVGSLAALAWTGGTFSPAALAAGTAAALCSAIGFVAFYASLARAPMGVATAIVAAGEVVVPVVVGVGLRGESLPPAGWLGLVAAAAGAVIVGAAGGDHGRAALVPVLLAGAAGVSFGLAVVALAAAPHASGLLAPTVEVAGGLALTAGLLAVIRVAPGMRRFAVGIGLTPTRAGGAVGVRSGLVAGALQGAANITLMYALWNGQLAVVGVVVCLYPLTTVALARSVLGETLTRGHLAGIALAVAGCSVLALS
ncbi:MAG: EamA family transporter [Propionicimonas sp.]|uniref:EamA family transporter n=1 Tax=Propionicimonas sp. TaxID=1955623 RepID=UPI003D0E345C